MKNKKADRKDSFIFYKKGGTSYVNRNFRCT